MDQIKKLSDTEIEEIIRKMDRMFFRRRLREDLRMGIEAYKGISEL